MSRESKNADGDTSRQDASTTSDDVSGWDDVCHIYKNGCITLVSSRRPYIPQWLDTLLNELQGRTQSNRISTGYRLSFADMQRMYMRQLQIRLIKIATAQQFRGENGKDLPLRELSELGPILRKYVQAVQDHEYMGRFLGSPDDPFIASSERAHDDMFLTSAIMFHSKEAADIALLETAIPTGPWEARRQKLVKPIASTRGETRKKAFLSRIGGAVVGGAFLIFPMWLMVLKQEIYLSLGVTTGCVAAFGVLMALSMGSLDAVFTATFAYAAVLMVFVGVMMQNTGSSS
ncbi:hypothetical protein THARTR1_05371 [Trichoderma harzianum]|uniref:DUF6594 domain-containing protein n=1 Tax=Trichoderma harzianum TaxID=5544 RepID=A0A2K0U8R0_TRIHA|nr:hypothetical protein THARTR1_05371 [Trichoderma harzianum]